MNLLEIIILILALYMAVSGFRKGFVKKLASMVSLVLSIVLVSVALPYVTEFLKLAEIDLKEYIHIVQKYEKVFSYINDHLCMNLTLSEIAKGTNYSIGFLTKCFVKDNKITVKNYIHNKIMAQAEQLLIYSGLPISDISEALGFCEFSYFTKWLKKKKNCTPNEYRKNMRSEFRTT